MELTPTRRTPPSWRTKMLLLLLPLVVCQHSLVVNAAVNVTSQLLLPTIRGHAAVDAVLQDVAAADQRGAAHAGGEDRAADDHGGRARDAPPRCGRL